jgi:hypothetical protein
VLSSLWLFCMQSLLFIQAVINRTSSRKFLSLYHLLLSTLVKPKAYLIIFIYCSLGLYYLSYFKLSFILCILIVLILLQNIKCQKNTALFLHILISYYVVFALYSGTMLLVYYINLHISLCRKIKVLGIIWSSATYCMIFQYFTFR